jgi:hypothetical protein
VGLPSLNVDVDDVDALGGHSNTPVERFNESAVKASIFRNVSKERRGFYNVTFARIYTGPRKGQIAETQSLPDTHILKVRRLADQACPSSIA